MCSRCSQATARVLFQPRSIRKPVNGQDRASSQTPSVPCNYSSSSETSMKTRRIGSLSVSEVGLGCNNFGVRLDYQASEAVVHAALAAGITIFDTADIYGGSKSEEYLGRALAGRREDIVIATKFGMPVDSDRKGASPAYVRQALEDSLRRLGTDWIDLYQLHQPDPA